MNPTELTTPQTEDQIPMLAAKAIEHAYQQAIDAGQTVLIAESGLLVEIFPDGTRRILRHLQPNIPVKSGQVIPLQ